MMSAARIVLRNLDGSGGPYPYSMTGIEAGDQRWR
jgi:hypothetical protein